MSQTVRGAPATGRLLAHAAREPVVVVRRPQRKRQPVCGCCRFCHLAVFISYISPLMRDGGWDRDTDPIAMPLPLPVPVPVRVGLKSNNESAESGHATGSRQHRQPATVAATATERDTPAAPSLKPKPREKATKKSEINKKKCQRSWESREDRQAGRQFNVKAAVAPAVGQGRVVWP